MADERDVTNILENVDTREGDVIHRINEGDSPLALDGVTKKNGSLGFSFVDIDGNAVLPKLNPEGAIVVSLDAGTTKRARGKVLGTDDEVTYKDICFIDLTLNKLYTKIAAFGSCFRQADYQLVYIDDFGVTNVEKIIGEFLTTSNSPNFLYAMPMDILSTNGGTGIQKLILRAKGYHKKSDFRGTISLNEIA